MAGNKKNRNKYEGPVHRHRQKVATEVVGSRLSSNDAAEIKVQSRWLQKMIDLQTTDPKVDPKTGEVLGPSKRQQKEIFSKAFKVNWSEQAMTKEGRRVLTDILAPPGTAYQSVWDKGFRSEIQQALPAFEEGPTVMLKAMQNALGGRGGRSANESSVLLNFISSQRRTLRPFSRELGQTLKTPRFLAPVDWIEEKAGYKAQEILKYFSPSLTPITAKGIPEDIIAAGYRRGSIFKSQMVEFEKKLVELGVGLPDLRLIRSGFSNAAQIKGTIGYKGAEINFMIPGMETIDTKIKGVQKHIGYTGPALNVRRDYINYMVLEKRGVWAPGPIYTAQEYYMKTVLEEILPRMGGEGGMTVKQARLAFQRARDIINQGELSQGNQFNIGAAQANLEDAHSAAIRVVQPTQSGVIDEFKTPILREGITAREGAEFLKKNAASQRFGADTGSGKLSQGILSMHDLGEFFPYPKELVVHSNLHQGLRIQTPSRDAVIQAYGDHTAEQQTRKTQNLKRQNRAIRSVFGGAGPKERSGVLVDPTMDQAILKRKITDFGEPSPPRVSLANKDMPLTGRKALAQKEGRQRRKHMLKDQPYVPGANKKYSTLTQGGMDVALDSKERLIQQADRIANVHAKLGNPSEVFNLTLGESTELQKMAARKNIPFWVFENMRKDYEGAKDMGNLPRAYASTILEAVEQVPSIGRSNRRSLGLLSEPERNMLGFTKETLPNVIAPPKGTLQNISAKEMGGARRRKEVEAILKTLKKGEVYEDVRIKGAGPAKYTKERTVFDTLMKSKKIGATERTLTHALKTLQYEKNRPGLDILNEAIKTGKFSPLDLKAEVRGTEATEVIENILKKQEAVVFGTTSFVKKESVIDFQKLPFASGGSLGHPDRKLLEEVMIPGKYRLIEINAASDLFTLGTDKYGDPKISLNKNFDYGAVSSRGLTLGLKESGEGVTISKQKLDSFAFRVHSINLVGGPDDLAFQIEFMERQIDEDINKLQGEHRVAGPRLPSNQAWENELVNTGNNIYDERGSRTFRKQRFRSNLMSLAEVMEKGKKPQQHQMQMLSALMMHQEAMARAYLPELTDPVRQKGSEWLPNYLKTLGFGDAPKAGGLGVSIAGVKGSVEKDLNWLLLNDANKFREIVQGGLEKRIKKLEDTPIGDLKGQGKYRAKVFKETGKTLKYGTWEHRMMTQRFMEYWFKEGVRSHKLRLEGMRVARNFPVGTNMQNYLGDVSKVGLHPDFFSEIFASVGTHFGDTEAKRMVKEVLRMNVKEDTGKVPLGIALQELGFETGEYVEGVTAGHFTGKEKIVRGDPSKMQGAGKMATIEPRAFISMESSSFGEHGLEAQKDFLKRMQQYDLSPAGQKKILVHEELFKTLTSLFKLETPGRNAEIYAPDIKGGLGSAADIMTELYERGQANLGTDKDLFLQLGDDTIYIPRSDIPGMQPHSFMVDGQERTGESQIRKHFGSYVEDVIEGDTASGREKFIKDIHRDWSPEGKGMGSYTRNRLPGSSFLIAGKSPVTKIKQYPVESIDDLFHIKITRPAAQRMEKELIRTNLYPAGDVQEMFAQLDKPEHMHVAGFRHPNIGPYSVQKLTAGIAAGTGDVVYVPEAVHEFEFDVISETGETLKKGIRKRVSFGPMLGMGGDYDFDTIAIAAWDPKIEKKIRKELAGDTSYFRDYFKHQIRYQLLNLREEPGDLSIRQYMKDPNVAMGQQVIQAEKLAIASQNIGQISTQITQAKYAALTYAEGDDLGKMMTLFEFVEQKPIGFKHQDAATLEGMLSSLQTGFETRQEGDLRRGIHGFLEIEESATNYMTSKQGVQITQASQDKFYAAHGIKIGSGVTGLDMQKAIPKLAGYLQRAHDEKLTLEMNVHRGKGSVRQIEQEIRNLVRFGKQPVGVVGAIDRMFVNTEQLAANALGAAGEGVLIHHRGIAALAAIGGLAALASMNSQPREMVGPGKRLNANVKMKMNTRKAHKRLSGSDVKPARAPIGSPMGPNLLSQRRAMIASHPVPSNNFIVRARANHPDDIGIISQQFQQFALNGGSVNISNSQRSIQNPYGEMNKLY